MTGFQSVEKYFQRACRQVKASWRDALCAGAASGIAWFISERLLGHEHPVYAAMTALICLAPGLPSHGRQAIYVLIGVLTGVLVGEMTLLLPVMPTEIRIALVGFIGLTLASAYAIVPAMIIQAGISAVMVFALGADVAGVTRVIDVMLGTGIGLLFSQVLFTPDQFKTLQLSVDRFFNELVYSLSLADKALEKRNVAAARNAMKSFSRTHLALAGLVSAIDVAQSNARWTLRGRWSSRELAYLSVRYDQTAVRLYASSLLFCESLLNALRKQPDNPPEWLLDALRLAINNCQVMSGKGKDGQDFIFPDRSKREEPSVRWRECVISIEGIENVLARFYKSKTRKNRLLIFRKKQILDAIRAEIHEKNKNKDKREDQATRS